MHSSVHQYDGGCAYFFLFPYFELRVFFVVLVIHSLSTHPLPHSRPPPQSMELVIEGPFAFISERDLMPVWQGEYTFGNGGDDGAWSGDIMDIQPTCDCGATPCSSNPWPESSRSSIYTSQDSTSSSDEGHCDQEPNATSSVPSIGSYPDGVEVFGPDDTEYYQMLRSLTDAVPTITMGDATPTPSGLAVLIEERMPKAKRALNFDNRLDEGRKLEEQAKYFMASERRRFKLRHSDDEYILGSERYRTKPKQSLALSLKKSKKQAAPVKHHENEPFSKVNSD